MDTQTLRTFLVVSSLKSFTQTAEVMFLAQSTVTNRIADLEREIGKKLFIRDKRNITLTKEGELFHSYAKRILELEEQSLKEVNSLLLTNTLHIGSTNTIYECHLYPVIQGFMTTHPDIAVKITLGHTNDLLHLLTDGLIDLAYTYLPLTKSGYVCTPSYTDELVLVTSSKNQEYMNGIYKKQLSKLTYYMCDFALQEVGLFIRGLFPDYYQFPFEIDNSTKLIPYLKDGTAYSFLPYSLVRPELEQGSLQSIPLLDFETPKIMSYCIYRSENEICRTFIMNEEVSS